MNEHSVGTDRDHQLTAVELGDDPAAWASAGFTVIEAAGSSLPGSTSPGSTSPGSTSPLSNSTVQLGRTTIFLTGEGGYFRGWHLDGVDADVDGLPSAPLRPVAAAPADHPNGCRSIDHIVVLTGDNDRTIGAFEAAGVTVRGTRETDTYGFPARQTFLWAGDVIIELIGPETDDMRNDNPVRVFGFALVSDDLDATKAWFGDRMGQPKDAVQAGRRIATVRHKEFGISLPIAVMSRHV